MTAQETTIALQLLNIALTIGFGTAIIRKINNDMP